MCDVNLRREECVFRARLERREEVIYFLRSTNGRASAVMVVDPVASSGRRPGLLCCPLQGACHMYCHSVLRLGHRLCPC